MKNSKNYQFLLNDLTYLKGVGNKTRDLLKKKQINTIFDLLWSLPRNSIDRTNLVKINELQIGKIQTITVNVIKYNFPNITNSLRYILRPNTRYYLHNRYQKDNT